MDINKFINELDIILWKHSQNIETLAKDYNIDKEFVAELSMERMIMKHLRGQCKVVKDSAGPDNNGEFV